jgi:hypothetical protein
MTSKKAAKLKRLAKRGRPNKSAGPKAPPEEVIRQLIEGIGVLDANGQEMRRVPSKREIARSFGVANSLISRIAEANDCARRHELYRQSNPEPFEAYERSSRRSAEETADPSKAPSRSREPTRTLESTPPTAKSSGEAPSGPKRKPGRPARIDSPHVPWNEVDNALVLGERVELPNGAKSTIYPSARSLARRYGVAHSAIVRYSQDHHCERRRETAQQRLIQKTEEKVIELRATAAAVSKEDVLRMIDKFLQKFEKAVDEDRVRYDVPADFNTLVRLREYVNGGPDSRQESTTAITLESLQERHARMLKAMSEASPAEMGIIDVKGHELPNARVEQDGEGDDGCASASAGNAADGDSNDSDTPDENGGGELCQDASLDRDIAAGSSPHPPPRPSPSTDRQRTGPLVSSGSEPEAKR